MLGFPWKSRLYHSGSRFAIWRWTFTPSGYITRLHLLKTPLGAICLHWINDRDQEPWLHDHPVSFLSLILRGYYLEVMNLPLKDSWAWRRYFNWVPARKRHTIDAVAPGGCLTLCFMGPHENDWGFFTDAGKIPWKKYNAAKYQENQR
jgi:hypothetical protein